MDSKYLQSGGRKSLPTDRRRRGFLLTAGTVLILQSAYLGVSTSPDLFYFANVFLHVFGGAIISVLFLWRGVQALRRVLPNDRRSGLLGIAAGLLCIACLAAAALLIGLGNTRDNAWILTLHIGLASLTVITTLGALVSHVRGGAPTFDSARRGVRILGLATTVAVLIAVGYPAYRAVFPGPWEGVQNPERPPYRMEGEAMGGAQGPFFPSSAETSTGGLIPSTFFMSAETCARSGCHGDIYEQWEGSAHRFSSFNNQWYRKSIEYMQAVNSVTASKWCGGCHDHAVLFNGMMDTPIGEILHTPEAQAGLTCNSCHAIIRVKNSMGNGGFYIEYPPLHDLAASENRFLRGLHDLAVQLDPGPHRRVFLKPFHREHQAEFCSGCHKVHLDVPVNNYRWVRGFNEYDNWQASGVSGQGARSFYYPPQPLVCRDCHMPPVRSDDKGNIKGFVHDHSFPAANTALPTANLQEEQLRKTIAFLQADQVTVDIFAGGPAQTSRGVPGEGPAALDLSSTFAVGEEAAAPVGRGGLTREPMTPLWAPLDRAGITVRRGTELRVDVVVRTRGVGHFFPGGTVDAFDTWLELRARDEQGRTVFWSGVARDGGRGPVEESAHFYRSLMLDAHGNPINKRNAWATRSVVYVNLIPPGAADVAHFRLRIPEDCGTELTLEARLNYRKFTHYNTLFSFAGRPAPGEPEGPRAGVDRVTKHWDDRDFIFDSVPSDVSAALREVPVLPIVVMDRATATLRVVDQDAAVERTIPPLRVEDRERWNDYGIGLLRQGDLKGAQRAFRKVIELDPAWPEGPVNLARVRLREGDLEGADEALQMSLQIAPDLPKAHYFLGVALKSQGQYEAALGHLRTAARAYPRDRVVRNTIGRTLFLQRRFAEAVEELQKVLEVDPEDLIAHYNLMLCYQGLEMPGEAQAEKRLYERFKADEDAQVITGPYRREHPEDNRERQPIHEHASVLEEIIRAETALREARGEPNVVLPGEAAGYARRVVDRGRALLTAGKGSQMPVREAGLHTANPRYPKSSPPQ